jgi:hypothetical protein
MLLVYVLGVMQVKLEQLNEAKKSLKAMVEEIKYSGSTGAHRRKLVRHTHSLLCFSSFQTAGPLNACVWSMHLSGSRVYGTTSSSQAELLCNIWCITCSPLLLQTITCVLSQVDENEEQLGTSSTRLERSRLKYERLAKLLIGYVQGLMHLKLNLRGRVFGVD